MIIGYYRKHILSLKVKLNSLDPDDDCFDDLIDLQVSIVKRILHTENAISAKKREVKELKRDLRTKRNSKTTSKALKKKISKVWCHIFDSLDEFHRLRTLSGAGGRHRDRYLLTGCRMLVARRRSLIADR